MHIKLLVTIILLGCSSRPPVDHGAEKVVLKKGQLAPGAEKVILSKYPPEGCVHLGSITGSKIINRWVLPSDEQANNILRNEALKLGGNVIEVVTNSLTDISGTAYKCPDRVVNSLNSSNQ